MNLFSKCKTGGILITLLGLMVVGCTTATIKAPACDAESVDFGMVPAIPANTLPNVAVPVTLPAQSVSFDFSDDINKINSVAKNLQIDITSLAIQDTSDGGSDLAWVRSVDVQITGSASDGSTPMAELGSANSDLQVQIKMSDADVLRYMASGRVTLTITISGMVSPSTIPHGEIANSVNLCVLASGDVKESL
jgi:hypothetical protein